jgi:hypothetical protein
VYHSSIATLHCSHVFLVSEILLRCYSSFILGFIIPISCLFLFCTRIYSFTKYPPKSHSPAGIVRVYLPYPFLNTCSSSSVIAMTMTPWGLHPCWNMTKVRTHFEAIFSTLPVIHRIVGYYWLLFYFPFVASFNNLLSNLNPKTWCQLAMFAARPSLDWSLTFHNRL